MNFICPFTHGLNRKRLIMAVLAVFAFIFLSNWLIHGVWLKSAYEATASLWRSQEDMHNYCKWMMLGQFLSTAFLVIIFARGYQGKGVSEGGKFALLMVPFLMGRIFMTYSYTPISASLMWCWVCAESLQVLIASYLAAAIYKH